MQIVCNVFLFLAYPPVIEFLLLIFFSKRLSGVELHSLTLSVIKQIESIGFVILRLVTDNHKTNVNMMRRLSNGKTIKARISHPDNPERPLFLAFDQCHILKNLRTALLEKTMYDGKEEISGSHIKNLYKMQSKEVVKPVPFLSRKHVAPTNFEKMNVKRAKDIFSSEVITALQCLKDNSSHFKSQDFQSCGATITFLKMIKKWFEIHDVRSTSLQHLMPEKMHFFNISDERLEWLENDFPSYLAEIRNASNEQGMEFLSKDTYEAVLLTSSSTVQCTKYLLSSGFYFVLTRAFNSIL